ncbi:30S ribosomal protein S11 [Patescibacteria group bacterium]
MTEEKIKDKEVKEVKETSETVETKKAKEETPVVAAPKKKKGKRQVQKGQAHIKCTYNNTIITISDANGAVLGWSSAGYLGFKGAKKSTPYAATKVAADVSEKVQKFGIRELMVFIKGVGGGREASIRGLANAGYDLSAIKDITPIPHNGCRPKKPRRV